MWTLGAIIAIIMISMKVEGVMFKSLVNPDPLDELRDMVKNAEKTEPESHVVEIEVKPKDPGVMGDGGIYIRCRTCGRDIAVNSLDIPPDASCPECGAPHFQFDVSQGG